jgi:hypothetical protein
VPRRAATLLAAVLALLPAGCGGGRGERAPQPAVPPTWSAARDEAQPGTLLLDVVAGAPCRIRVRIEGLPEGAVGETVRSMAAGESARLSVLFVEEADQARVDAAVTAADRAAERTVGWILTPAYQWEDGGGGGRRRQVVGTRPGRGRVLGPWFAIPSRTPTQLAFGADLDLAAAAIVDGAEGATLDAREGGSRLRGALDVAAGDRATLLRVVLRAERLEP